MERKDEWLDEIKRVFLVGGIVCVCFVLAVIFSFIFFPNDVDSAAHTLITFTLIGAVVAIVLLVKRSIYWFKRIKK